MVMCDTPGGIFTPEMKFAPPRTPLSVDATPAIGSMPTYAADYFSRQPEMAVPDPRDAEPKVRSQAERDLLKALRMAR